MEGFEVDVVIEDEVGGATDPLLLRVLASISTCILDPLPLRTIKTFSMGASVPATAAAAASTKMGWRIRRRALINQLLIWFSER